MRKNKMMRTAAVLGVAALLTTSALSGTLAKYTTSVSSSDSARVATWGFTESSIDLKDLFATVYKTGEAENVKSGNNEDVIAPGTAGKDTFDFTYGGEQEAPEVAYKFTVSTEGSEIDTFIKANKNILWKLDGTDTADTGWGTWDELLVNIQKLAGSDAENGSKEYKPGELPSGFNAKAANTHTVAWKWDFEDSDTSANKYWVKDDKEVLTSAPEDAAEYTEMTQDQYDSYMGNMKELDDVTLKITITATQID